MNISETQKEVQKSLYKAGIHGEFTHPSKKLSLYGKQGERVASLVNSGVIRERMSMGDAMFLVGNDKNTIAVFHLLARAIVLSGENLRLISAVELRDIVCFQKNEQSMATITQAKVLAIEGFFDSQFQKAFSEPELYAMGWWLTRQINGGVSVMLQSSHPIGLCGIWSSMLRDIIASKSKWQGDTL